MALDKQIHIYSVDTSAFYNDKEMEIHKHLNVLYSLKKEGKLKCSNEIQCVKEELYEEFSKNKDVRKINSKSINTYNIVSVFESVLTRTLKLEINNLYEDIIIVRAYFFDIIKDIILNGFMHKDVKYVCFTASAGQIRTKKTVFIKESLLNKHMKELMCGLTIEDINNTGGMNINKYLAYLALCNSATDIWDDFDINKSIVVEDMETMVNGVVDFIDDKTYEITRKEMDIPICHTDGCGMILPKKSKKSMMVRLPWVKGLLVPFPFDRFIKEQNKKNPKINHGIIKDIYGLEHNILEEGIEVIFTKSQFKMYAFYKDWQSYINNFKLHNCHAGKCNEEEQYFKNAKINYQMLQSLVDINDEELEIICERTKNNIKNIASDRNTMLKVFGATKYNKNKSYFQQALEFYPELLSDVYTREVLKQIKASKIKEARSAKIELDAKYTFITPDLYSFCEYLFLNDKNPKGLLEDGEVFCWLYKDINKLSCLRSPHLYREWAIRNNKVDSKKRKWFITNGLYTSCHDLISKILQFDVDGDKSLVCSDSLINSIGERNMDGIVPLFYNMAKAGVSKINNDSVYEGLRLAYTGGNIGVISNDITKIWNSDSVNIDDKKEEILKVIKLLCMENNFVIDYAKTLYKPIRPQEIKKLIRKYTKFKTPHFFIYAKNKDIKNVEEINNSVVNRLENIFPDMNMNFKCNGLGKFNYRKLMRNRHIEIDEILIKIYTNFNRKNHHIINRRNKFKGEKAKNNATYIFDSFRNELISMYKDEYYITDVLVKHLYNVSKSRFKETLWQCFGNVIIENLNKNIKESLENGYVMCENCGVRIKSYNTKKYCEKCAKDIEKDNHKKRNKKWYKNKISDENQTINKPL